VSPRIRRSSLVAAGAIAGALVLLVAAWAIDTGLHSGGAMRNVALDGHEVGGLSQSDLSTVVEAMREANGARRVSIETPAGNLDTTAKDLGLDIDEQGTMRAALDAGRDGAVPLRPFAWFGALFTHHDVPVSYRVDEATLTMAMSQLAEANETDPKEPAILVADDHIVATPGVAGQGLALDHLPDDLVAAAHAAGDPSAPLTLQLDPEPVDPRFSDGDVQQVAQQAIDLSREPLAVHVAGATTTIEPATLRTWMRAVPSPDSSHLVLGVDAEQASTDVTKAVGDVGTPATEVTWHVQPDDSVTFTPGANGTKCCAPDTSDRVVQALQTGQRDVTLDLTVATPTHDTAWAQQMNIHQPIASFTTPHACCESRVQNIHRISDIVRGAVVAPGETFSLNGFVGPRTSAKGFVEAGVIYNGSFTSDVGGGVSQFTTTLFNAAFFAGLDFVEYQAHTIYISRYPYGREATLSYPKPDLKFTNNTPYGILIWPTYTGTSVTVTLYSSPWVTGDQTGQTKSPSGRCTKVTTERTRTWVIDGRQEVDSVSALYQPGEGVLC
jgi:vancomycin resistance protein YoaR